MQNKERNDLGVLELTARYRCYVQDPDSRVVLMRFDWRTTSIHVFVESSGKVRDRKQDRRPGSYTWANLSSIQTEDPLERLSLYSLMAA
jgi:hypothetical protein